MAPYHAPHVRAQEKKRLADALHMQAPAAPTNMENTPLGKLPAELRNLIWGFVLKHESPLRLSSTSSTTTPTSSSVAAILLTCKQAKRECREMFWWHNTFVLDGRWYAHPKFFRTRNMNVELPTLCRKLPVRKIVISLEADLRNITSQWFWDIEIAIDLQLSQLRTSATQSPVDELKLEICITSINPVWECIERHYIVVDAFDWTRTMSRTKADAAEVLARNSSHHRLMRLLGQIDSWS